MDDAEVLPVELLMHPPYHIFYVKARVDDADGFFYWLDYDITEMRILWLFQSQTMLIMPEKSIKECILAANPGFPDVSDEATIEALDKKDVSYSHTTSPLSSLSERRHRVCLPSQETEVYL